MGVNTQVVPGEIGVGNMLIAVFEVQGPMPGEHITGADTQIEIEVKSLAEHPPVNLGDHLDGSDHEWLAFRYIAGELPACCAVEFSLACRAK